MYFHVTEVKIQDILGQFAIWNGWSPCRMRTAR